VFESRPERHAPNIRQKRAKHANFNGVGFVSKILISEITCPKFSGLFKKLNIPPRAEIAENLAINAPDGFIFVRTGDRDLYFVDLNFIETFKFAIITSKFHVIGSVDYRVLDAELYITNAITKGAKSFKDEMRKIIIESFYIAANGGQENAALTQKMQNISSKWFEKLGVEVVDIRID
jgi:hypothetical protein